MPTRVQIVRQAGLLGKLYVYEHNDNFWRYNPKLDRWTSLPLPPSQHLDGVMSAVGDKIYLTGGSKYVDRYPYWEYNTELDVYDQATGPGQSRAHYQLPTIRPSQPRFTVSSG